MGKIYLIGLLFIISNSLLGQSGKITGKVINSGSGQVLGNATITLLEKSKTEIADLNGNFAFSKLTAGTYSIKCSYIGYNEKIIEEIIVKNEYSIPVTISLEEKKASQEEVVVVSRVRARSESVASLLIAQKNSASVSDGISAESIRKTPDRSTGDVLKRVSGASIQDDRFAIIRGLNDRYNAAFINGAPLPSTESDRKAFAFDIFPASILDNLVIYKTATPDKSGEFAGGIIDITTKSILSKGFTSISVGLGYNTLITRKTRYSSENKGSQDWIGNDDGTRGIPGGLPSTSEIRNSTFAEKAEYARLFGNYKWGLKLSNTAPNLNFQFSKGFNVERKQKEFLGFLFSLNYNRNFTFSEGERNSYDYDPDPTVELSQRNKFKDSIYNDEIILAALANVSVKINNRNNISWKNNLSINTDNRLIKREGPRDFFDAPSSVTKDVVRWFTSNQIFSSQLNGEHLVGPIKTKINWLAAYSKVNREIPNLSRTSYQGRLNSPDVSASFSSSLNPFLGSGTMFFVNSDENIKSIKADITQPYKFMHNSQNFVKIGGGYQIRKRDFTTRLLGLVPYDIGGVSFDNSLLALSEGQIFSPQHLGLMKSGKGGFLLSEIIIPYSNYDASSATTHAYIMNDQRFFKNFRLIYGVRMEKFNQKLNTIDDGVSAVIKIDTVVTDFLPSLNFVYALTPKMNVRLSYAETINRPEFRELAPFLFYDYVTQVNLGGYEMLQRAKIKNYDFRYEFFPGRAQLFSVSAFYKEFANPIEIVFIPGLGNQATYINATSAEVYGVEAEFRTLVSTLVGINREDAFLSKFTLSANAAYMKSGVKLESLFGIDPSRLITDRALQGQSPYLINGSVGFNDEKTGFSSTVSVNRVGDRIYIAGIKDEVADIYEKARTVVDFQLTKFFVKNKLEIKFTARDILAQRINFYSDFDLSRSFTERDKYFSSNIAPKVFSFSATYKF